jgi:mannose-6-phosphate isomerase
MSEPTALAPFRLNPVFSERVWGRPNLKPWYEDTGTSALVGEAWLTGPQCTVESGPGSTQIVGQTLHHIATEHADALLSPAAASSPAPEFPLLVKMLFPNDKLSVQVHPDDLEAQAIGQPRGKTECWYVLEAEPGATVALGLKPGTTLEALAASALDGTMESLLEHVPVSTGDMVFVDAGTVHAIGHGVVLLETQQTCDITYRLYDYGRPRELHLEQGLKVVKLHTAAGKTAPQQKAGFTRLIEQKYFTVDRFDVPVSSTTSLPVSLNDTLGLSQCLVSIAGTGTVRTNTGEIELVPGEAVIIPASSTSISVEASGALSFVRCFEPAH